ncbi:asparaginase [Cyclobacteriaceae bacterium]|nr:asparaginase [Cyclobacteriaceae bacterium]MDB4605966.1 asparaginase [Cyclobacteriaceae bacterium]MDB4742350.1 asparaginase [Cyclobacteriaceae bacterium]
MNYKIVKIRTSHNLSGQRSILIIYTGGTIGMVHDESGSLVPFNFIKVMERIPELSKIEVGLTVISFPKPIDSSNVSIRDWQALGYIIYENYDQYDGFVILHGTDTMAYSASALSFMLEGLAKPVIFTGAQIPIGNLRSDARENLITAIEIAADQRNGTPLIKEVCIYFNFGLFRGNRSQKMKSSTFAAFESQNYPLLAESGIDINYNEAVLAAPNGLAPLRLHQDLDDNVALLKIFPGLNEAVLESILGSKNLKGLVMETFGSGNIPNEPWFIECLKKAVENQIIILNVSQCSGGEVIHGRYETSRKLSEIGIISGGNITTESAITKLMLLLGSKKSPEIIKNLLVNPMNGEMN